MNKALLLSFISPLFSVLNAIVPSIAGSKLATSASIAQTAVKSAVTAIDGGVDHLQAAFANFESRNPVVAASVTEFVILSESLGVALPTQDAIVTHVKAAVADLAGILAPQVVPATPVPAAVTVTAPAVTAATPNTTSVGDLVVDAASAVEATSSKTTDDDAASAIAATSAVVMAASTPTA